MSRSLLGKGEVWASGQEEPQGGEGVYLPWKSLSPKCCRNP